MSTPTSSTSPTASQPGVIDPLVESILDLSDYEGMSYQSPTISPEVTKAAFVKPAVASTTPTSLLSTTQPLTGPSHQYDLYKQQTGIVPGALANTLAVNQNNSHISGYNPYAVDYLALGAASDDLYDFNTSPTQTVLDDIDMDFASPTTDPNFFFQQESTPTVNPSVIETAHSLPSPPVVTSNVGRLWPGMHQQAALAKAQAQQRQQQQIIQQQQQRQNAQVKQQQQHQQQPRPKNGHSSQPSDPIVEQKITQLLNSMRAKSAGEDSQGSGSTPVVQHLRSKKDEDDMDEDERLLASEEGKKLTSKERRQLRNKVSARAFRSRRKEYISQLEAEIANKVSENGDLRAQNRALLDENKRLTDLTRMLLSSPSFSDFLNRLSSNPDAIPQSAAPQQQQPQQQQQQPEQRQESRQLPKDVNPYTTRQNAQQHQQIGIALMPEQTMDFSMLSIDTDLATGSGIGSFFQPQVYTAVLETPEVSIDTSLLSGKTSNFVPGEYSPPESSSSDDEGKVDLLPGVLSPLPKQITPEEPAAATTIENTAVVEAAAPIDDEFERDPEYALYHGATTVASAPEVRRGIEEELSEAVDIFGGIVPEKVLARLELVDADEEHAAAEVAMARVQRLSEALESVRERLEKLTC